MSDTIYRQEAIDTIYEHEFSNWCDKDEVSTILNDLPSAERLKGVWIHDYHFGLALPEHKCSVCGEWEYSDRESNFCPNCGARMKGADDE